MFLPDWEVKMKSFLATLLATILSACATQEYASPKLSGHRIELFDLTDPTQSFIHLNIPRRAATEYRISFRDGRTAIRAEGKKSASILYKMVEINPKRCPIIEWAWRVERLQPSADISVKEKDDVAASIGILFGDPGFFPFYVPVPTIRYVWTNNGARTESVIANPHSDFVQNIVVESGHTHLGEWITVRRNLLEDFARAFGREPESAIYRMGLFTDNDQTLEAVVSYYAGAHVECVS